MGLISFKGIYPYVKKMSVGLDLVQMPASDFYNVPLKVKHIAESEPVVRVGDIVKQGTLLNEMLHTKQTTLDMYFKSG